MSKDPSTLSFQSDRTRTCILAAYWAVVVLSLPLWWYTTSIERLSLPTTRVFAQATRQLRFPIQVTLEADAATTNDLQQIIDRRAVNAPTIWSGIDVTVITKAAAGVLSIQSLRQPDILTKYHRRS
jgi:phosphatidylinositol glycan class S